MSEEERRAASEAICRRLLEMPAVKNARTILSYEALPEEADLKKLHEALGDSVRLCFPVSLAGGVMQAWEPGGWTQGRYGIREPDREKSRLVEPGEIDLVLAPCVGFDRKRDRLGHGAGYYDRYLPQCRARVIAVAFECQKLKRVAADRHDRTVDAVVTEERVY